MDSISPQNDSDVNNDSAVSNQSTPNSSSNGNEEGIDNDDRDSASEPTGQPSTTVVDSSPGNSEDDSTVTADPAPACTDS